MHWVKNWLNSRAERVVLICMKEVNSPLASFFDNIKLGDAVDSFEGPDAFQRDLDVLDH